jgi:hypothetical protein
MKRSTVMSPAGLGTKIDCAGPDPADQKKFRKQTELSFLYLFYDTGT